MNLANYLKTLRRSVQVLINNQLVQSCFRYVNIDFIGRKKTMIFVNIPFGMAWLLLYCASSVQEIFIGFIMLGITRGLAEAPSYNFSAEVTEPSLRSILIGLSGFIMAGGASVVFILNTFIPWRDIALISLFIPVISIFVLLLVSLLRVHIFLE